MKFSTTLWQTGNNTGIEVPPEVVELLGSGKRPPVNVAVNGFHYRSTIAVMGGKFLIPFSADKRRATGLQGGDAIEVELTLDTAPRTVELPDDFAAALEAASAAKAAYEQLSPSAKKAHVTNIEGAKAEATRQRRIERIITTLGRRRRRLPPITSAGAGSRPRGRPGSTLRHTRVAASADIGRPQASRSVRASSCA